jgi:double-stranded uracil-DNA glycosylase
VFVVPPPSAADASGEPVTNVRRRGAAIGPSAGPAPSAVPDILAPGLRAVFCGINPGRRSAAAGHHFANPRNDFWRLLHEAGLTPRRLDPSEQHELVRYGYGLTNAAYRTTAGSGELRRADFAGSAERLERLAAHLAPKAIAFVGKEAFRGVFGERPAFGLQQRRLDATDLFVLPSTSPANAAVPYAERLRWFKELARLVRAKAGDPSFEGGSEQRRSGKRSAASRSSR